MFHEPDTRQNADPAELEAELFPSSQPPEPPPEPLRFSLAQLLIGMTIAAVLLALFRTLGIYGAALSFTAALIFTLGIYPQMAARHKPRQALMFDFVWGVVMPVVCLVFDPLVFKGSESVSLEFPLRVPSFQTVQPAAFVAYPLLGLQVLALSLVLVIRRLPAEWAAAFSGILCVGSLAAGAIGVVLFPISTLGLIVLVGMLGYTPLLTAFSYGRRTREMWQQARSKLSWQRAFIAAFLGAILAVAIPAGAGLGALAVRRASPQPPSIGDR